MRTLVLPDLHGNHEYLESLLIQSGALVGGHRSKDIEVISIGDLINGTEEDQDDDAFICQLAQKWIDKIIIGNHETHLLNTCISTFEGAYESPFVQTEMNRLERQGKFVPALLIGDTLLTHAGVHADFMFPTATDAFMAIWDSFQNYWEYIEDIKNKRIVYSTKDAYRFTKKKHNDILVPRGALLDGVSTYRDGQEDRGGILWADHDEPKSRRFSQIFGHTPKLDGPILTRSIGTNVFSLNIDSGAKSGKLPWAVMVDEYGELVEFIQAVEQPTIIFEADVL